MNAGGNRALAVSVHDVSPLTREVVDVMLRDLASAGLKVTSLLVVPDHHHRANVDEDPEFLAWLRARQEEGHEIVLHGFYHRREAAAGGGLVSKIVTEHYTAGEGEFYDLDYEEARRRMEEGREMLTGGGLEVAGFIAPAWLLGEEAEQAARNLRFAYTTRLAGVLDLRSGAWTASQSLVWSVRSGWRRTVSRGWNAWLARRLRKNPLVRLGLHPPDWKYPAIKTQALRLARELSADRRVVRYRDLVKA
ncbi:MAG: polysaccharide deacetylase family protein [Chthoniobacterales bacterium]